MKKRTIAVRVLSFATFLSLILPLSLTAHDTTTIITADIDRFCAPNTVSTPLKAQKMQKNSSSPIANDTVASCITDATWGEFLDILSILRGENPTADKNISEPGQNTKNNVAISLIEIIGNAKAVRNLQFVLKEIPEKPGIKELYAIYTPVFSKNSEEYATGVWFDYNTETIYREDGTGILGIGYDFNFDFNTFSSSDDPWQRNFGFCETYDHLAFTIGDVYSTIRVPFNYGGKDWMIQIWKGIYSFNMLGGEIGVYTKPESRSAKFYDCASDLEKLPISFTISHKDKQIVEAPLEKSWWQTAFTYHSLKNPQKLSMSGSIIFPDVAMAKAFTESLSEANSHVEYSMSGSTVTFTWPAGK